MLNSKNGNMEESLLHINMVYMDFKYTSLGLTCFNGLWLFWEFAKKSLAIASEHQDGPEEILLMHTLSVR